MKLALPVIAALILGLGCGAETETETEAVPELEPLSDACRRDAARIESAFSRPEGSNLFRGVAPAPFSPRGAELQTPLPRLLVSDGRITIDDVEVSGAGAPAALAAEMEVRGSLAPEEASDHGAPTADAVLLYVPAHTRLSHLRLALSELDPSLRFDLVVQHSGDETIEDPRPPRWLDDELAGMRDVPEITARRERFRGIFTRAAGECAEARAHAPFLFGRDPDVPEQAAPTESLADAMLECRCAEVDVAAMVAIGILTGPPNRRPLRRLSFVRVPEPTEGAIDALDTQTIEAFVTALVNADAPRRARFVVPE